MFLNFEELAFCRRHLLFPAVYSPLITNAAYSFLSSPMRAAKVFLLQLTDHEQSAKLGWPLVHFVAQSCLVEAEMTSGLWYWVTRHLTVELLGALDFCRVICGWSQGQKT